MDKTHKIARKFKVTIEDAEALVAAGLDTPTKIKAQVRDGRELPAGLAEKLVRWRKKAAD